MGKDLINPKDKLMNMMGNGLGRPGLDAADQMRVRIESGDAGVTAAEWKSAAFVAAGWDPYELVDEAVAVAAKLSGLQMNFDPKYI